MGSCSSALFILILISLYVISAAPRPLPQSPPPLSSSVVNAVMKSGSTVMSVALQLVRDAIDNVLGFFDTSAVKNLPRYQRSQLRKASREAVGMLEESRFSFTAPFLESHLMKLAEEQHSIKWTVFAPADDELRRLSRNFDEYPAILMRHVVPSKVDVADMAKKGTPLVLNDVEGNSLVITKQQAGDDTVPMVNGLEIMAPNMYQSKWLVIHGVYGVIPLLSDETEL